jgi:hypothetical protein
MQAYIQLEAFRIPRWKESIWKLCTPVRIAFFNLVFLAGFLKIGVLCFTFSLRLQVECHVPVFTHQGRVFNFSMVFTPPHMWSLSFVFEGYSWILILVTGDRGAVQVLCWSHVCWNQSLGASPIMCVKYIIVSTNKFTLCARKDM